MQKKTLNLAMALSLAFTAISVGDALAAKKLRFWAPSDWSFKILKEKFEKDNPGVQVDLVSGDIDKFYTMITAGMMPDVWGPWDTPGIHADVNRNWAMDLSPYIKRDSASIKLDDFYPGVMSQFKVAGKQYSLPVFSYADYFFYNTQMYAQAGLQPPPTDSKDKSWTWDKMLLYAQKTTKASASGKMTQAGLGFSKETFNWPNWYHLWGASPYKAEAFKDSIPDKVYYDTPEMTNALTKMWELQNRYKVSEPGMGSLTFVDGKMASTIEFGWNIINYMNAKKLKWAIAPLPWAVTNKGTLWPDGWRISRMTKDKELAWKFVKYITSPEAMRVMISDPKATRKGSPAARKSVFRDTLGRDIAKATGMNTDDVLNIHEASDEVGIIKYQETVCLHADLSKYIDPIYANLWNNRISPKEAVVKLQSASDKALVQLYARWIRNQKAGKK